MTHRSRGRSARRSTRVIRLATAVDQADDTEAPAIEVTEVRRLLSCYKQFNSGVEAQPEEEASADQLAGLRLKLDADLAPFADWRFPAVRGTARESAKV